MKFIKRVTTLLMFAFLVTNLNAQRIKLTEVDFSSLKDESSINVEFTYDGMYVGKFSNEKDYTDKKKDEYNAKESGRGDSWLKSWVSDRTIRFQPKFNELFEEYSKKTVSPKAKYTLIFHTTSTEPGYNIYITRKNAEISGEVTIVETANRSKKLATISVERAPGRTFGGYDYDTGLRIAEAYACAGKKLGKFLGK